MKRYEIESFVKSFLLFFILIASLYTLFLWQNYSSQKRHFDEKLLSEMQIFSYSPLSNKFNVDFVPYENDLIQKNRLIQDAGSVYALFMIPNSKKYLLKISISLAKYKEMLSQQNKNLFRWIVFFIFLIAMISIFLAYYSLSPIRRAIKINEEFLKDILHDVNTPLSAMVINLKILRNRFGEDRSLSRMENSVETIKNLQLNLKSYLNNLPKEKERFNLAKLVDSRVEYFRVMHPDLKFIVNIDSRVELNTTKEAFIRIIDNIISNACKYNKKSGEVIIGYADNILSIEDTGVGIRYPERAFDRYYKEGERGLGLGLHIVKEMSKELGIGVSIQSQVGEWSRFELNLSQVIFG